MRGDRRCSTTDIETGSVTPSCGVKYIFPNGLVLICVILGLLARHYCEAVGVDPGIHG